MPPGVPDLGNDSPGAAVPVEDAYSMVLREVQQVIESRLAGAERVGWGMTCTKCGDEITLEQYIPKKRTCKKCRNTYYKVYRKSPAVMKYHRLYMRIRRLNQAHENGCDKHHDCFTCPFEDCIA